MDSGVEGKVGRDLVCPMCGAKANRLAVYGLKFLRCRDCGKVIGQFKEDVVMPL
jgi:hypothetical protein